MYVCSRELVPFDSKLIQGVCSFICTRESVPFILCSASLSCLCFGQRTLFPFSLYCWTPAPFWSIIFLHLIKKKKEQTRDPPMLCIRVALPFYLWVLESCNMSSTSCLSPLWFLLRECMVHASWLHVKHYADGSSFVLTWFMVPCFVFWSFI